MQNHFNKSRKILLLRSLYMRTKTFCLNSQLFRDKNRIKPLRQSTFFCCFYRWTFLQKEVEKGRIDLWGISGITMVLPAGHSATEEPTFQAKRFRWILWVRNKWNEDTFRNYNLQNCLFHCNQMSLTTRIWHKRSVSAGNENRQLVLSENFYNVASVELKVPKMNLSQVKFGTFWSPSPCQWRTFDQTKGLPLCVWETTRGNPVNACSPTAAPGVTWFNTFLYQSQNGSELNVLYTHTHTTGVEDEVYSDTHKIRNCFTQPFPSSLTGFQKNFLKLSFHL